MSELFSKGHHAEVHLLTDKQRHNFPHSDLVRTEVTYTVLRAKLLFYAHRIVHDLFPDNFIDVQGVQWLGSTDPEPTGLLYNRFARTPPS